MWHRLRILTIVLAMFLVTGVFSQDILEMTVNVSQEGGTVSPYVYGANYGLLNVIPVDLVEEMKVSGVTFWRFPGGRVGDLNDLQPSQIDFFIAQAKQYNVEPLIHVRLENGTPEKAVALLRYVNEEKGYGVRYWSIGNEPDLFDDYPPERHVQEWRTFAEAMLAVDPDIILVGPDLSQFVGRSNNPYWQLRYDWLELFLETNGDLVDIVAVHRYPFPSNATTTPPTLEELYADTPSWDGIVESLHEMTLHITGQALPVAITEASSHWSANIGGQTTPDSGAHAIWWSDVLGRMIKNDVFMVGYFNMQSSDKLGGWGILGRYEVRPTFYVYQLYQQFGTVLLDTQTPDEDVTLYASKRDDGAIALIMVNRMQSEQTRLLNLIGLDKPTSSTYTVFSAIDGILSPVVFEVSSQTTVTMPAQSVALLVIPASP